MSRPNNPIHAPSHHGAVGYMIERSKGHPSFQPDTSCSNDLELAFKSVAYANEFGSLTRTSVHADQAAVHTLLEALTFQRALRQSKHRHDNAESFS